MALLVDEAERIDQRRVARLNGIRRGISHDLHSQLSPQRPEAASLRHSPVGVVRAVLTSLTFSLPLLGLGLLAPRHATSTTANPPCCHAESNRGKAG